MARNTGRVIPRAERLDAVFGERGEPLSSRTFFAETSRSSGRPWIVSRSRLWLRRTVPVLAIGLATWLGAALGSGVMTAEGQYEGRMIGLRAPAEAFAVPEVTGHPGAADLERRHALRQLMALNGGD